jgi:hypothetical protein
MPNTNARAPRSPLNVRSEMTGSKSTVPLSTNTSTLAASIFANQWQVGGAFAQIVPVTIAGLAANATAIVKSPQIQLAPAAQITPNGTLILPPIPPFPSTIVLSVGQVALIVASVTLAPGASAPSAAPFIGLPYVQISLLQGTNIASTLASMGSTLTLVGAGTFSVPTVVIYLPVFATAAGFATQVINLSLSVLLLGLSS